MQCDQAEERHIGGVYRAYFEGVDLFGSNSEDPKGQNGNLGACSDLNVSSLSSNTGPEDDTS